ncbi:MAG: hypothetical protein B5M56_03060 [Desulfococcus sp. 4484_241]|nr:MAG: hypothetical protein B5M56_03060 [Desulfococcus sp. 4484_241]
MKAIFDKLHCQNITKQKDFFKKKNKRTWFNLLWDVCLNRLTLIIIIVKNLFMGKHVKGPTRQYAGVDAKQRRKERREKFIAAGLDAFGTVGYARSTIKEICRLAGLTERYFYESFENKEDLLCTVFRRLISQLEADAQRIIETPGLSRMEIAYRTLEMFYQRFKDDPRRARIQLFEVLGVSPRVDKEYQESIQKLAFWTEFILADSFPGIDRNWLKNSIIPMSYAGGILAVAHKWYLDGFTTPLRDLVAPAVEMFLIIGGYYQEKGEGGTVS